MGDVRYLCVTKPMKEEDGITIYICTNSIGVKLLKAVIDESKTRRYFKTFNPPVPYFSNKNT